MYLMGRSGRFRVQYTLNSSLRPPCTPLLPFCDFGPLLRVSVAPGHPENDPTHTQTHFNTLILIGSHIHNNQTHLNQNLVWTLHTLSKRVKTHPNLYLSFRFSRNQSNSPIYLSYGLFTCSNNFNSNSNIYVHTNAMVHYLTVLPFLINLRF